MENRDNGGKIIAVIALVLAVVGLSIGFAALQTKLEINGTAEVTGGKTWDIKFVDSSLKVDKVGSAQSTDPTVSATTIKDYKVTLAKPGDKVSYYFQVTNAGDFDAKIGSVVPGAPVCSTEAFCANVKYSFTYTDSNTGTAGAVPSADDTLAAGETKWMLITVEYVSTADSSTLPTETVTITGLNASINYVQA